MSWNTGKSRVTYEDLYNRTKTLGGDTYSLKSGQNLVSSKHQIEVNIANTILDLDQNAIPTGLSSKRVSIRDWIVATTIQQQDTITGFASPLTPAISEDGTMFCVDPSLSSVIYFNPTTILTGTDAISIPFGTGARPASGCYVSSTNKYYVTTWNTSTYNGITYPGGLHIINCSTKTIEMSFAYGTDGNFSRGNVFYISDLDEVWAVGNTGFIRINATLQTDVTSSSPSGFSLTGAVFIASMNSNIYVFSDGSQNNIKIYNTSLTQTNTISNLCSNTNSNGQYTSRGYYANYDEGINRIYLGEISTQGGVIVFDTLNNVISNRVAINLESHGFAAPGTINFHPLRNGIYIGGSLFNNTGGGNTDIIVRLWLFNAYSESITQTVDLTMSSISNITYVAANSTVYLGNAGEVPESTPNTDQLTDGVFVKFN